MDDYVVSRSSDILAMTETWFGNGTDQFVISDLVPSGYQLGMFIELMKSGPCNIHSNF